jgi:hypothetical protein
VTDPVSALRDGSGYSSLIDFGLGGALHWTYNSHPVKPNYLPHSNLRSGRSLQSVGVPCALEP